MSLGLKCIVLLTVLTLSSDIEANPGPVGGTRSNSKANIDGNDPTLHDVMTAIQGLTTAVTDVKTNIADIHTTIKTLTDSVTLLRETTDTLQKQHMEVTGDIRNLKKHNEMLRAQLSLMENKIENQESHSRRKNLIFSGIPSIHSNETSQDCENTLKSTLAKELNTDMSNITFDRVHRINTHKTPHPIIAKFTFYKDRETILRKRSSLRGTNIYINEDYTHKVREIRKQLLKFIPQLKRRNPQQRVTLVFDHLYIDNERYVFDPVSNVIKCKGRDHEIQLTHHSQDISGTPAPRT